MSVDLHRIGTGISSGSSRNGFGNIVSFPSVSFPAYGTFNSWLLDVEYPIANGGASVTVLSVAYPSQFCDVQVENDGSGGTYTDWTTATDVQYYANATFFYFGETQVPTSVEVPTGSGNSYTGGSTQTNYYFDGAGSFYTTAVNQSWYSAGTSNNLTGLNAPATVQVPSSGGTYYNDGTYTGYTWNGSGGYNYPVNGGSLYSNGTFIVFIPDSTFSQSTEVPSGSGTYYNAKFNGDDYFWNGSGGYNITSGSYFYTYGTFIYNDGSSNYYWDGAGGYYT